MPDLYSGFSELQKAIKSGVLQTQGCQLSPVVNFHLCVSCAAFAVFPHWFCTDGVSQPCTGQFVGQGGFPRQRCGQPCLSANLFASSLTSLVPFHESAG